MAINLEILFMLKMLLRYLKKLDLKNKNKIFNIGTGKSVTINKIAKIFGGKKKFIPKRIGDLKFSKAKNI